MMRTRGHSYNPEGRSWVVPAVWIRRGRVDDGDYIDTYENTTSYELNILQRLFVMMEYPNSSVVSQMYAWSHTLVILICVIVSYLGTMNRFQYNPPDCASPGCENDAAVCPNKIVCSPEPLPVLWQIDIACYVFYSIDIGLRMLLSPLIPCRVLGIVTNHWDKVEARKPIQYRREEPDYPWYEKSLRYLFTFNNLIDLIATLPYFVELCMLSALNSTSSNSALIVTTVRLGRCVRLLKLLDIHPEGSPRLNIIIKSFKSSAPSLILLIGIVVVSAVIFGSLIYTAEHGNFRVTADYPDGEYFRTNLMGELEQTPFQNLGTCMYWAIVTMTTLGYGDLYPTTGPGRFLGSICCIYGIIIIAMPVTVVNNCFTNELDTYKSALKVAKKVHNKQQKQQVDQERLERASTSSDKAVGPGGGGLLRRYTMPLNELVEIPGDLVRKSKMTSNGLFSIPYEKNRPRSLKEGDIIDDILPLDIAETEEPHRISPDKKDSTPAPAEPEGGKRPLIRKSVNARARASGAAGVPYVFREANKIHIIAKEIATLKETLSGLEQVFEELFLDEGMEEVDEDVLGQLESMEDDNNESGVIGGEQRNAEKAAISSETGS